MYQKINHKPPTVTLYSDASSLGSGAYIRDQNTGGNWSVNEVTYQLNIKEMLAVKFALKSFAKESSNVSIKIIIDNTTVISVLKNMGTSHNFHLNSICRQIWEWCKGRNIWLFPVYINTKENLADRSSRITYIQGEWMLEKRLFNRVLKTLKSSRLNHQLPTYVSYKPDPNAYAVDAFSLVWKQFQFYCFPPFSCITECLQKIKKEENEGLHIVPVDPPNHFTPSCCEC